jgi:hypothetical protein
VGMASANPAAAAEDAYSSGRIDQFAVQSAAANCGTAEISSGVAPARNHSTIKVGLRATAWDKL